MNALTIALIEALLKYGPAGFIALMKGLDTYAPTPEQIRSLKVQPPEYYLGGK